MANRTILKKFNSDQEITEEKQFGETILKRDNSEKATSGKNKMNLERIS